MAEEQWIPISSIPRYRVSFWAARRTALVITIRKDHQRYRDVRRETYSKGVGAYIKLLREWRDNNELEGLELT